MLTILLALLAVTVAGSTTTGHSCQSNPSTVFFKVGNITAQVTSDGPLVTTTNGFAVPDAAVLMSYALLRRSVTPAVLGMNVVVLHLPGGRRAIVESGSPNVPAFPDFAQTGQLLANLRASGVPPESIDAVLLTHGHFDHVAGLVTANGSMAFPNARVYITEIEHRFWAADPFVPTSDNLSDDFARAFSAIYRRSVAPYVKSGRLSVVQDGESPLEGITFRLAPGHAPGLAVVQVESAGKRLFAIGDAWISQADQVRHPEWRFFSEHNTTQGYFSRTALMEELATSGDLVVPYHEQFPGIGYIIKTAYGYDWVPSQREMLGTVSSVCKNV